MGMIKIKISENSRRELLKQAHKRNMLVEEYITLIINDHNNRFKN